MATIHGPFGTGNSESLSSIIEQEIIQCEQAVAALQARIQELWQRLQRLPENPEQGKPIVIATTSSQRTREESLALQRWVLAHGDCDVDMGELKA